MHLKSILSAVIPASFLSFGLWHSTPSLAEETTSDTKTVKLKPVKIEADFREANIQQSTSSVTVVTPVEIQERDAQNIEDVIGLMPNVNAASGGATAHYYQIRGIGERGQFSTPLNPSVGVLVDDFDYSRIGAAATMFDVNQVEVLRGPQGTRFGSGALAGVIQVQTNEASLEPSARVEATVGSHNTYAGGVMLNGPIVKDRLAGRLAIYQYNSDGYIENTHLDKKNTQKQDELTARANLKWYASDDLTIDLKLLHLNLDDGYDAFSFTNDNKTISDQPGQDSLKSDGIALKADYAMTDSVDMVAILTQTDSTSKYGYDDDWTYVGFDPNGYSAFDFYKRDRKNQSLELRFMSSETGRIFNGTTDWVGGIYYLKQDEKLHRTYPYVTDPSGKESSDYKTNNLAAYGQLDYHLTAKATLIAGLRIEQFQADYDNSYGFSDSTDEVLYGGKLGASYQVTPEHLTFVTLSRGYKSGGVNDDASLPKDKIPFDAEYLWNLEAGLNSSMLNNRLNTRLNVFYGLRKDQQVNSSTQQVNSPAFTIYMDNAAESTYYGLEGQADWLALDQLRLLGTLGLLQTEFTDYTYVDPNNPADDINMNGRALAHAPGYTFSFGGEIYLTDNWTISANIEGKDAFYFSDSHDQKSKAYSLVNSAVTYNRKNWTVTLWGKNLGDTQYATRGYYFGIDPRTNYSKDLYTQQGAPRTYGVTVAYDY